MTETENSSATLRSTPDSTASGRVYMPPLTRASLNALCDAGGISPGAWQKAMEYCGFRPDGKAWLAYWRQLCLLGGALFFVAGVVCFIAWNWGAMTPLARMALTGAVVASSGLGAVLLGPETRLGRVLLLVCGLAVGPMLAVFGQTYQTGAELWELFRVWTAVLVLLALAGRQAGLWFVAWLAANMFGALWLGRALGSPLDALVQTLIVPEWLVAIACVVVCWEWAAYRATLRAANKSVQRAEDGTDHGANHAASPATEQPWFCSRWMPRMLYFDLVTRTALFLHGLISGLGHSPKFSPMLLSGNFVVVFAVGVAGLSWWWYRTRQPDLFMLASLLAAGAAVLLSAFAEAELFRDTGTTAALLLWGLLVTGMTAGLAKILLHLQASMATAPRHEAEALSFSPSIFGRTVAGASWQTLWAYLQTISQKDGLVPQSQSLAEALGALGEQPSPWYVRAMLAFGGWVSAVLFICFFGFLLFSNLHISSNEELIIFVASVPVLLLGRILLPRGHMFARHFGFAMAIAGTAGVSIALCLSVTPEGLACFALTAVLFALAVLMRNVDYTGLVAVVTGNCVAMGIAFYYGHMGGELAAHIESGWMGGPVGLLSLWWTLVCVGLACYCLREDAWRGAFRGKQAEAWFYGLYTSALIFQVCTLAPAYSLTSEMGLPGLTAGYLGLGAALAVAALACNLSRGAGKAARLLAGASILLAFALSWYLPGVGLALLGLALARQMGSVVMQGFVLAYLFAYMVFYYYSLAVPFSLKSLYLVVTGIGLLAVALVLRLWQAKQTAGEAGHA